jgi:hypothetical protein
LRGLEENRRGSKTVFFKAALSYAKRGIPVFFCEPGGKGPLTYNGFWDATTALGRVKDW